MANVPLIDEGTANEKAANDNARHKAGHLSSRLSPPAIAGGPVLQGDV
jgi:hypothetical protein